MLSHQLCSTKPTPHLLARHAGSPQTGPDRPPARRPLAGCQKQSSSRQHRMHHVLAHPTEVASLQQLTVPVPPSDATHLPASLPALLHSRFGQADHFAAAHPASSHH